MIITLEYANGAYRPLGQADNIDEANFMVHSHLAALDPGNDELPAKATVWERGEGGNYVVAETIEINTQ